MYSQINLKFLYSINKLPDKKDYFDRVNYIIILYLLFIFNRIELLLKVSKTFVPHTLNYN